MILNIFYSLGIGHDTIQERVEQGNSDSSIIVPTVQFYGNNHNSESDHWNGFKIYTEFSRILFYVGVNFRSIKF